jgi:hypothetical protein
MADIRSAAESVCGRNHTKKIAVEGCRSFDSRTSLGWTHTSRKALDVNLIQTRRITVKSKNWNRLQKMLLASILFAVGAAGRDITQSEREQALKYLADTRDSVTDAVKGLSEAQLKFKPAPDRWSVAETLEHIALTEDLFVHSIRPQLENSPASPPKNNPKELDDMILTKVPDRSTKFQAPPPLVPTGKWTPAATLEHFLANRDQSISFLKSSSDLREHRVDHPALGSLDGYEWILAIAAHSDRHTKQILEIKADPNFPAE